MNDAMRRSLLDVLPYVFDALAIHAVQLTTLGGGFPARDYGSFRLVLGVFQDHPRGSRVLPVELFDHHGCRFHGFLLRFVLLKLSDRTDIAVCAAMTQAEQARLVSLALLAGDEVRTTRAIRIDVVVHPGVEELHAVMREPMLGKASIRRPDDIFDGLHQISHPSC